MVSTSTTQGKDLLLDLHLFEFLQKIFDYGSSFSATRSSTVSFFSISSYKFPPSLALVVGVACSFLTSSKTIGRS
ncbi:hypothetical protein GIB67_018940 [Kingdonia uniflora]|uniref:Uncharacterized protein n=1 Tax=Kingdonia uniflora TaxID=39325 RepID=A0A7J7L2P2_9MAGN|nr:hypothetical protein GIB67_018940 [Kingdonia uniflora]